MGWHSSKGLPPALVNDFQTPQPPPRALNFLLDLALLPSLIINTDGSSIGLNHAPPDEHPFHLPPTSPPLGLVDPKPSLWVTTVPHPPCLVLGLCSTGQAGASCCPQKPLTIVAVVHIDHLGLLSRGAPQAVEDPHQVSLGEAPGLDLVAAVAVVLEAHFGVSHHDLVLPLDLQVAHVVFPHDTGEEEVGVGQALHVGNQGDVQDGPWGEGTQGRITAGQEHGHTSPASGPDPVTQMSPPFQNIFATPSPEGTTKAKQGALQTRWDDTVHISALLLESPAGSAPQHEPSMHQNGGQPGASETSKWLIIKGHFLPPNPAPMAPLSFHSCLFPPSHPEAGAAHLSQMKRSNLPARCGKRSRR